MPLQTWTRSRGRGVNTIEVVIVLGGVAILVLAVVRWLS
jgi:hypothetical protein